LTELLHSPDFWIGIGFAYALLALLLIVLAFAFVPELRNLRWPPVPANSVHVAPFKLVAGSPLSRARQGRAERAAGRIWPHDDYAANEEGELRLTDWRRESSALPWDQARHAGGDL
jgi:hypothetical protein